jgi:general secretion pathway protein J
MLFFSLRISREEMPKQAKPHVGTSGFTLLEMVVTLTILGFILLIIFGAFRLGLSAWEKGESSGEEYQKVRAVSQLLSQQLKSMVPYKVKTEKAEGDYLAFEGKSDSLKFVSAVSIRGKQPKGFVYVTYAFREGGNEGGRLVVYEQRVLNRKNFFEEGPDEESGVPVIEGISEIQFEYYREGDSAKNEEEAWTDGWDAKEEKELPKAVRMTVTYKNGQSEKEALPTTLLASVRANRFEDMKSTLPAGSGVGRIIQRRLRGSN